MHNQPPQLRLLEASKLRYDTAIVPAASKVTLTPQELGGMKLQHVRSLGQALAAVFGQGVLPQQQKKWGGSGGGGGKRRRSPSGTAASSVLEE